MRNLRAIAAVLVLSAVTMWGQAAPATTPDAAKPAEKHACKRDKDGKMECCKKDKDGKMANMGDCCKNGKCVRMAKKDAATPPAKS